MTKKRKRTIWIVGACTLFIGGGIVYARWNAPPPEYSSLTVVPSSFIQSVEETGVIDTQISITYGWETSGRVVDVFFDVGDMVTTTAMIATLDNRSEANTLRQAQSQLAAAEARLAEVLAGPTDADRQTYEARIAQATASMTQAEVDLMRVRIDVAARIADAARLVEKATATLGQTETISQAVIDAYANLENVLVATVPTLRDALTAADNILGVDNAFANDAYESVLGIQNLSSLIQANSQYTLSRASVQQVQAALGAVMISSDHNALDRLATDVQDTVREVMVALDTVLDVLEATPPVGPLTPATLSTLQSSITAQKTIMTQARTSLTQTMQALTSAKTSTATNEISLADAQAALENAHRLGDQQIAAAEQVVEVRLSAVREAEATYAARIAAPRAVDVAALRADIARQRSIVEAAQITLDNLVLRALTDGTITHLAVSVGETVSPHQDIVTIQSNDRKIEVDISESDIAKVSLGDVALVELDAYDGVVLDAVVTKIDPAATEISGVVYYKTTLEVVVPDDLDIRPGMTADVQIITEQKDNTIAIPRRAVLSREDGTQYVRVLTDTTRVKFEARTVTVGITGDEGLVEIVSGLVAGEEVITFLVE